MNIAQNCKLNMKYAIMNENAAFRLRYPISILISIIVSIVLKDFKSVNRIIAHVLIPIVVFLLILFIIDISVRSLISKEDLRKAELKCDAITLNPNKYKLNPENDTIKLESTYRDNIELHEDFESTSIYPPPKPKRSLDKLQNLHNYIKYNENRDSPNNISDIIQDSEYSSKVPENDKDSSSNDLDLYATLNPNVENEIKNSYTQSIDNLCSKKGCCLINNKCGTLCPGPSNSCNVVAPIPGPQWQVQKASIVQDRLKNEIYTSSRCSLE